MYRCVMGGGHDCEGEPRMKNGAGCFCPTHFDELQRKKEEGMRASRIAKMESRGGLCMYCGEQIGPDGQGNRCHNCITASDYDLKRIRWSGEFAKSIARREEREAPERDARLSEQRNRNSQVISNAQGTPVSMDVIMNMVRQNALLTNRIATELGIK